MLWLERTAAGVMLSHELRWNSGHKAYDDAHRLLCDWGYRRPEKKVWNYWDEDVAFPVRVDGPDAASLALARRGSAVVVVSSFAAEDGEARLRPDCAALGVPAAFRAFDLETGAALPVADGVVRVPLKKYDFAMVELRK